MITNLSRNLEFWRDFNLIDLQKDLDKDASDIAIRQDESELNRKKLVDLSREFKKTTPEELRKKVAPLLKSFQLEIDSLTKRSKDAECSFLNCYKKIVQIPDPTSVLEFSMNLQKESSRVRELEIINKQLRERLDEYNNEFAEVKNQEVTVKHLRERIKELEDRTDEEAKSRAEERERGLAKAYNEKEQEWAERQTTLSKKLGEAELRAANLLSTFNGAQTELFEVKAKYEELMAAKNDEVDLLMADLERSNEKIAVLERASEDQSRTWREKENGERRRDLEERSHEKEHVIDLMKRTSLEVELASKEKEVAQLVADVQQLQQLINKMRSSGSSQVARLEEELQTKSKLQCELEEKLNLQRDYEEIKRELRILKSLEFSCLNRKSNNNQENDDNNVKKDNTNENENKSLEVLLLEKNHLLQSENTTIKCSIAELKDKHSKLEEEHGTLLANCQEQKQLIGQLEEDLRSVNALSIMFRGDAEGEAVVNQNQNVDFMANLVANKEASLKSQVSMDTVKSATSGLLPIVQSQRERFRVKAQELEAVSVQQQQQIGVLQNEMDKLRTDNLKLYEKVKFLQGYTHNRQQHTSMALDDTESKYSNEYNQKLDPFRTFNRNERHKRYMGLKPYDKITLGMGRFIMSNKVARTVVFFYTLLLHVFVFLMLYKLAYNASCQRDNALEDWHQKFNEHMASHHPGSPL